MNEELGENLVEVKDVEAYPRTKNTIDLPTVIHIERFRSPDPFKHDDKHLELKKFGVDLDLGQTGLHTSG